jgi:hypothetical protein
MPLLDAWQADLRLPWLHEAEMPGEAVPLKPPSAERTAHEETKHKKRLLKWAAALAEKVIGLAVEDANLRFRDNVDDEESDLTGAYDPIVDATTGARLSEHIKDSAAKFRTSERVLKHLYQSALGKRWKAQEKKTSSDLGGARYGKFLANRHGVWAQLDVVGIGQDSDLVSDAFEERTRLRPHGDDLTAAAIHARRLRDLGTKIVVAYKGTITGACPLDRAGMSAEEAFRKITEQNGGYCFLLSPANLAERFGAIATQANLAAKGDTDAAQKFLEHQKTIPFEMNEVGQQVSAKCNK